MSALIHTGQDTQMSSSMPPVASAGEINMQGSTKLSGTHKQTWKEGRERDVRRGRIVKSWRENERSLDGNVTRRKRDGGRTADEWGGVQREGLQKKEKREGEGEECIRLRGNTPEGYWREDESRNQSDTHRYASRFHWGFTGYRLPWRSVLYRNVISGLMRFLPWEPVSTQTILWLL